VDAGGRDLAARCSARVWTTREKSICNSAQGDAEVALEHGKTPPYGLAVDANHFFVAPAEVARIDRQIRHLPGLRRIGILLDEAFADRVLVAARERGEHELAA